MESDRTNENVLELDDVDDGEKDKTFEITRRCILISDGIHHR